MAICSQLGQAYADVRGGEVWLVGASISEYAQGDARNHVTDRDRKLLLKRSEIDALAAKVNEKGLTLVPTKLYFKDGRVKLEVALGRGKDRADKRRTIADRDTEATDGAGAAGPTEAVRFGREAKPLSAGLYSRPRERRSQRRPCPATRRSRGVRARGRELRPTSRKPRRSAHARLAVSSSRTVVSNTTQPRAASQARELAIERRSHPAPRCSERTKASPWPVPGSECQPT